jgi:hypothetical protein
MSIELFDSSSGKSAQINSERQLSVSGVSKSEIAFVSENKGDAFTVYAKRDVSADNTNEGILYLKYTGSRKLHVASIWFSSDVSINSAKVEVYYDPTYSSGGTLLAENQGILNQNRQSSNSLDILAYHGGTALSITVDSNLEVFDVRLPGNSIEKKFDGLVLGKNKSIGIIGSVFTGNVAAGTNRIRCMVECYEVD